MSDSVYYNLPQNISPGIVAFVLGRLFGATINGYNEDNIKYNENGFVQLKNNKVSVVLDYVTKDKSDDLEIDLTEYQKIFDSENEMFYSEYDETKIILFNYELDEKEINNRIELLNGNVYQGSDVMQYMFSVYVRKMYDSRYNWPDDEYSYPSMTQIEIGKNSANIAAFKHVTDILGGYLLFSPSYNGKEDIYLPEKKYGLINCEQDKTEDEFKSELNQILINAPFISMDDISWANKKLKEHNFFIDMKEEVRMNSLIEAYQVFREKEEMLKGLNKTNSLIEGKGKKDKPRKW